MVVAVVIIERLMMSTKSDPKKLPQNVPPEVLDSVIKIAGILATKFKFGYYTYEDMKQEGIIVGLECLERYDPEKGALETFLWTHIHNQLFNIKRKHYRRPNIQSTCCQVNDIFVCTTSGEKEDLCPKCQRRIKNNETRRNLTYPLSIYLVDDELEPKMSQADTTVENAIGNEIQEIIESNLPSYMRADYLKIIQGVQVSSGTKKRIQGVVKEILDRYNLLEDWEIDSD